MKAEGYSTLNGQWPFPLEIDSKNTRKYIDELKIHSPKSNSIELIISWGGGILKGLQFVLKLGYMNVHNYSKVINKRAISITKEAMNKPLKTYN